MHILDLTPRALTGKIDTALMFMSVDCAYFGGNVHRLNRFTSTVLPERLIWPGIGPKRFPMHISALPQLLGALKAIPTSRATDRLDVDSKKT